MSKYLLTLLVVLVWTGLTFSGVIRKTQNEISFKGTGKLIVQTTTKIEGNQSLLDSKKKFKGKGLMGGIMAKTVLRPGHTAKAVSLDNQTIMHVNHNKQTFRMFPLEQIDWEEHEGAGQTERENYEEEREESNIRIIKNEFTVHKTGKNKTINKFPSNEFLITWVVVWEDVDSGDKGTDSLSTHVWTTQLNAEMKKAQQEEMEFNLKYAKKIGIDIDEQSSEMLGTQWMNMFRALNPGANRDYNTDSEKWKSELQKIKGYPVLTNGKYYALRIEQKEEPEEEVKEDKPDYRNPTKLFGSIMKKSFGKKKTKKSGSKRVADFTYRTELIKLENASVPAASFQPPAGYTDNTPK